MTNETVIVDRVQVDLEDLKLLNRHVAIPAAHPMEACYVKAKRPGWTTTRSVHGFNAAGEALVFNDQGSRLVSATVGGRLGERFIGLRHAKHPLTAPFTPAPPGMTAVFEGDRMVPVSFYDAHGRAVLIGADEHRELYLAEEDEALVRIDGPPL